MFERVAAMIPPPLVNSPDRVALQQAYNGCLASQSPDIPPMSVFSAKQARAMCETIIGTMNTVTIDGVFAFITCGSFLEDVDMFRRACLAEGEPELRIEVDNLAAMRFSPLDEDVLAFVVALDGCADDTKAEIDVSRF